MAQATSSPATQGWISGARGQEVGAWSSPAKAWACGSGGGGHEEAGIPNVYGRACISLCENTEKLLEGGQHPLLNRRPSWHSQWPIHIAHVQMAAGPGSSAVDVRAGLLRPRDIPRPMLFTKEFYLPLV